MKKSFFSLIIFFVIIGVILTGGYVFLHNERFIPPIRYRSGLMIRNDNRGEGHFGTHRSGGRTHDGLDLLAPVGVPVFASRSGIVTVAKEQKGMGKYVVIRHIDGMTSLYGHLSEIFVTKNQIVGRGKLIGLVGKTGNANYRDILPHLHFEIRKNRIPQDPLQYLQ